MRGLEKSYMKRGHQRNKETNIEKNKQERNKHTSRLLDQLGPEGRVGEKKLNRSQAAYKTMFDLMFPSFTKFLPFLDFQENITFWIILLFISNCMIGLYLKKIHSHFF